MSKTAPDPLLEVSGSELEVRCHGMGFAVDRTPYTLITPLNVPGWLARGRGAVVSLQPE